MDEQQSPPQALNLGIIGTGEIAAAIVDGLARHAEQHPEGTGSMNVTVSPRGAQISAELARRHEFVAIAADNQAVVDASDIVLLSVLPDSAAEVLPELTIPSSTPLISAVAATSIDDLRRWAGTDADIVRTIPMPAVRTGGGLTAIFPEHPAAHAIFDRTGSCLVLDNENDFATLSTASATLSSHFFFIAAIARWLEEAGLEAGTADAYVRGLFAGAGPALDSPEPLDTIARSHETAGGINEQLRTGWFDEANRTHLDEALDAVRARVMGA